MSHVRAPDRDRVEALRRDFDRSFSDPVQTAAAGIEDLLAIRVADEAYALRMAEIAGLVADRRILPLPSPAPEFLGIAGHRGGLLPVYSLRALLGYPRGEAPRWVVLAKAGRAVGLAFDRFEGHLRIAREDLAPPDRPEAARQHVREVARSGGTIRQVLNIASILEVIVRRAPPEGPSEES